MTDQDKVEQLWYTWSDVGLDTLRRGFRIRAATDGLQNISSDLMYRIDRYLRYVVPLGLNPASVKIEEAPVCLALIRTDAELILVRKVYTGQDAFGRPGVFFVHALVGLPNNFSTKEAIALWEDTSTLWKSDDKGKLWKRSDASLPDRRMTHLEPLDLQPVRKQLQPALEDFESVRKRRSLSQQNIEKLQTYLPALLQLYLTGRLFHPQEKIYIAASDQDVADLIDGLTNCLPPQFTERLTFSTYEPDITKAATDIVGTCWLSQPDADHNPATQRLLPTEYYQGKLAINCYTGKTSPLEDNPLLEFKLLAHDFAHKVTDCFLGSTKKLKNFKKLFRKARQMPNLTVDEFLSLYDILVVKAGYRPSKQDILNALFHAPEMFLDERD